VWVYQFTYHFYILCEAFAVLSANSVFNIIAGNGYGPHSCYNISDESFWSI